MRFLPILLVIPLLCGCLGDQKGSQSASPVVNTVPQMPSTPAPLPVASGAGIESVRQDIAQVRTELQSSANTTQNQMSGLVNASVSKISEKMVGIESNIDALAKLQIEMRAEVHTDLNTTLSAITDIKTDIKNDIALSNKIDAAINATLKLENKIGDITARFDAMATTTANAQVGLKNDLTNMISTIKNDNTAGRDVNYLPKEAVQILESNNKTWIMIITGFFSSVSGLALVMARNARKREEGTNKLLMQALAHCPVDKAKEFLPPPPKIS